MVGTWTIAICSYAFAVSYAVCFPSLAPFLEHLEAGNNISISNATSPLLGVAVASFSGAKVVAAPLAGCFTARFGVQPALVMATLLLIAGNALYACANSSGWVIVARVILGTAGCSSTPCRTWVSAQSGSAERARLTSIVSSATTLGYVTGPLFGGVLFLRWKGEANSVALAVGLRGPGALGALLGSVVLLALACSSFRRRDRADSPMTQALTSDQRLQQPPSPPPNSPPHPVAARAAAVASTSRVSFAPQAGHADTDANAMWLMCATQLAATAPLASFEALVTPFTSNAFGFSGLDIGILFAGASACTLLISMGMPRALRGRYASARGFLLLSLLTMGAACFGLSLRDAPGFVSMLLLYFSAYASSQVSLYTVLNENFRVHPRCAEFMGWISAAGSLGRCAGPLWAISIYNNHVDVGDADGSSRAFGASEPVWLLNGGAAIAGAFCVLIAWRQLVPAAGTLAGSRSVVLRHVERSMRAMRTAIAAIAVGSSYVLASTYSSPQVLQANQPPYSSARPTADGGGFCFVPPCDAFSGHYKSPLWVNPTGTPPLLQHSPHVPHAHAMFPM